MNESLSELEDRLRGMLPASPDHLTEDTFYQAGWHAAVSSMAANPAPRASRTSGVRVFASGLACGLAAAVVGMGARKLQERPVQTNLVAQVSGVIADKREKSTAETAPQAVDLMEARAASHRSLLTSPLLPWNWAVSGNWALPGDWTQPVQHDRRAQEEQEILSAASRVQWSCLLVEEGNQPEAPNATQPVASSDSEGTPLRAFSGATSEVLF